ncbi:MAG: hypothetical protein R2862_01990 [Thermoanaerobaculia bacterium]
MGCFLVNFCILLAVVVITASEAASIVGILVTNVLVTLFLMRVGSLPGVAAAAATPWRSGPRRSSPCWRSRRRSPPRARPRLLPAVAPARLRLKPVPRGEPDEHPRTVPLARRPARLALLLGIVLHATMSFFFFLPAQDVSQSTTLAVTFYVIHIFRMSVFYLIAGFFARLVFHRRGARALRQGPREADRRADDRRLAAARAADDRSGDLGPPHLPRRGRRRGRGAAGLSAHPSLVPLLPLPLLRRDRALRAGVVALDRGEALRNGVDRPRPRRHLEPARAAGARPADDRRAVRGRELGSLVRHPHARHRSRAAAPALVAYGSAFGFGWLLHRQTNLLATPSSGSGGRT